MLWFIIGLFIGIIGGLFIFAFAEEQFYEDHRTSCKAGDKCRDCGNHRHHEGKDGTFLFSSETSDTDRRICTGCVHRLEGCTPETTEYDIVSTTFYAGEPDYRYVVCKRIKCDGWKKCDPE